VESVERLRRHAAFRFHPGSAVTGVDARGETVRLRLADRDIDVALVVLGTGFRVDIAARPELAALADRIRLWRDLGLPAADVRAFADHPVLADDFSFTPRSPADAWVRRVHAFNIGAMASLGLVSGDIPGVGDGARRLGEGMARSLFLEDAARHMDCITSYDAHEIPGDALACAEADAPSAALERAS
jgi:cation diffusion facilitator CzcD-associated flavoprotein CzcO